MHYQIDLKQNENDKEENDRINNLYNRKKIQETTQEIKVKENEIKNPIIEMKENIENKNNLEEIKNNLNNDNISNLNEIIDQNKTNEIFNEKNINNEMKYTKEKNNDNNDINHLLVNNENVLLDDKKEINENKDSENNSLLDNKNQNNENIINNNDLNSSDNKCLSSKDENSSISIKENNEIIENNLNLDKQINELINSNLILEEKLNKILSEIEKEKNEFIINSNEYNEQMSKLDSQISKLTNENKEIYNKLSTIKKDVNVKYNKIEPFNFGKAVFKRKKNIDEIFNYSSLEQLNDIKDKQIINYNKSKNILEKEIQFLEKKVKDNLYLKDNLKGTYNLIMIYSKNDQLKIKLFELNQKIINLKKEIRELEVINSKHEQCEKKIQNLLEKYKKIKEQYLYEIENNNNSEFKKINFMNKKKTIEIRKRNNYNIFQKKIVLKKTNSELNISSPSNQTNKINRKLIESLYKEYKNDDFSNEKKIKSPDYISLFKIEEKNALMNFVPLNAIKKFENKFEKIVLEKKHYINKFNEKENELKNKISSLNNLINENVNKNKIFINSTKSYQKHINVQLVEIQYLKRKINGIINELDKEKKNELKLIEKNNIISDKIKLIRNVFNDFNNEDIPVKENIKTNFENKIQILKRNKSESLFKNNQSELIKLPKNIIEVNSEINFLTKSDKEKQNESEEKIENESENKKENESEDKENKSENKKENESEDKKENESDNKIKNKSEDKKENESDNKIKNESEDKKENESENKIENEKNENKTNIKLKKIKLIDN